MPMQNSPSVSVILNTYKRPAFLREAIASLLAQTFPSFEVIVVDDGSDDETTGVVAGFEDERIVYVYQENAGQSAALNRGLALARGEYVSFLDDDDRYLPHNLARQVACLQANPQFGLVGADVELIASDGQHLGTRSEHLEARELEWPACLYACPLIPSAVMLRREWLGRLDYWFDPELVGFKDVDFWTRLYLAGCRMQWRPEIISAYRRHAGQMTGDAAGYYQGNLQVLDKVFARADLPFALRAERQALYGQCHLLGACGAYFAGNCLTGQERLRLATQANPLLMQGTPPAITVALAGIARSVAGEDAPALIGELFNTLPPDLGRLRPWRRHTLSALHMQQVFAAHNAGGAPHLGDWLHGVFWNPRWLTNRGVWSILVRDVLMGAGAVGPGA